MENKRNKKWAILCSGIGNNIIDIINILHHQNTVQNNFEISLIIYDNNEFAALEAAKKHGIETLEISKYSFQNSKEHQRVICNEVLKREIDFIFLLNYKYLIQKEMLDTFPNKIINIHPSLFPSFLATKTAIQDALAYGVKITGITTHIIDDEYDKGLILYQTPIKIKVSDTFESLYPKFRKKGKKIIIKTMQKVSNFL
ncbi:formyltransferase family protein [Maribacter sp. BPC-D8]|uniref:formyltransferase family protein n=1 Tax=Maribacter sp. BPC-D8 TaxID=3053613 RepID=UPI002B48A875|nr:formyltransferase family protein [Maribacter sp. BPC-D8]WRI31293.1 formyltransferase family protein [Maribacter sp. BPC-D8]